MARKTHTRSPRPRRISVSVGQALLEAQERKRQETAAAMRRIAGAA